MPLSPFVCTVRSADGRWCDHQAESGSDKCFCHRGRSGGVMTRRRDHAVARYVGESPLERMAPNVGSRMKLGPPREVDPGIALLEEIHRTAGHVAWLEAKVRDMDESELIWGQVMEVHEERTGGQGGDYDLVRRENRSIINTWYQIYMREREHLARVSVAALKAGIEERKVRLAERGIDALEAALSAALADLGHDPHDPQVRSVVGSRLREVVAAGVFDPAPGGVDPRAYAREGAGDGYTPRVVAGELAGASNDAGGDRWV